MKLTASERFNSKTLVTPDHWFWIGAKDSSGHGVFRDADSRLVGAHRFAWESANEPIPVGMYIDHMCRVRHCVNPSHLRTVTPKGNSEDRISVSQPRPFRLDPGGTRMELGVSWRGFEVLIESAGKRHFGGSFDDVESANAAAIELHRRVNAHKRAGFRS